MNKVRFGVTLGLAAISGSFLLPAICQAVSNDQIYHLVKQQQQIISQQQKEIDQINHHKMAKREHAMPAIDLNNSHSQAMTQPTAGLSSPTRSNRLTTTSNSTKTHVLTVKLVNASPSSKNLISQASSGSTAGLFDAQKIVIGSSNNNVSIFGQIGMLGMLSADGKNSDLYFGSNTNNNSRLSIVSKHVLNSQNTVGTRVQLGFQFQQSNQISQPNKTPSSSLDYRQLEVYWKSPYGTFYLGKGSMASDNTLNTDFSGTRIASRPTVADIGGGLLFMQQDNTVSSTSVANTFIGLDGLGRKARFRYDTPNVNGFVLSLSQAESRNKDIALKYGQSFDNIKFVGQLAYTNKQTVNSGTNQSTGNIIDGSASILVNNGFNLSVALAKLNASKSNNNRKDPYSWLIKPGYRLHLTPVGVTAIAVNYGRYNYFAGNNERGTVFGGTVVQNYTNYNFATFADYRHFKLSGASSALKKMNVFSVGVLYRF